MLAHHPITGKPIRIIKTETHLYKNKKTLIWLRNSPSSYATPERFKRWETLVTSADLAEEWHSVFKSYPSAILLTNDDAKTLDWLKKCAPKKQQLLFLSKKCMDTFGIEQFTKYGFVNVICLEEMAEMYPHTIHTFQQKDELAITVLSLAALFRTMRAVGFTDDELSDESFSAYAKQLEESYGLQVVTVAEPEQLWLIQQYYTPAKSSRAKELRKCLDENLKNPYIDKILLLNETDFTESLPTHPKLLEEVIGRRLTYTDVIRTIQVRVPEDTLAVFSNSDIYLDDSWRQVWSLHMHDVFLSLLRYEEPTKRSEEPQLFGPRSDSQDTWVLHSNSVKSREWDLESLAFEFGKSGCDNAVNVEMLRKKFVVANPALSLKTLHCHGSGFRTYDPKNVVEKPVFLYLEPTGLHDLEPLKELTSYEKPWKTPEPFSRRIHSANPNSIKTFCTMVSKQEHLHFTAESENIFTPQVQEHVYQFKNGFTTPNGLVYGYKSIYMGNSLKMRESWANTTISHMTPCIGIKKVLAVPLEDDVSANMFKYLQVYLARVLRLKSQGYDGDFWMPRDTPRLQEFMQFFRWKEQVMPVIPRDPNLVSFSEQTTLLTDTAESLYVKEDIDELRNQMRYTVETPANPRSVVLLQDDNFLSSEDVLALETALEEKEYEVTIVYPARSSPSYIITRMTNAAICITGPNQHHMFWMLPKTARVIELMAELQIVGEGAHTAGAASLEYWVILLARSKTEIRRKQIIEHVLKTLEARPIPVEVSSKPLILLPKGFEGLHGHSGDSFREMVGLWFEQGLVELEYTSLSPYVWLNAIGDTLLYDRANFDWLKHTPAKYKKILCGNPSAKAIENGVQWSFWPRRPALVEQYIVNGLPSYEERTDTLVFYGKVENGVQEKHRKNELHNACDKFSMPLGAYAAYEYTQEEYLDKLAHAKFGLCMAGFGPKCNREIECMALGTVPVVAPDVDMDDYAVPLVESVHYIRLVSWDPSDAKALVGNISQDRWMELSAAGQQWYKENASVSGLWNLTQRLIAS